MRKKIVFWIRQRVKEARAKGIVLGLSGGIDSSVAAALAKEAVGKDNVLGLYMPIHSQPKDLADARLAARKLGIKTRKVDLSGVYDALAKVLPAGSNLARANLKPRLRMLTLYYFANNLNYIVCGTGNKSELMVGYFTKYGDGGVDILPIASLLKRQVRRLAEELKIPEVIITKPPTAGLWQGQTDEGEMGITYAELDDILDRLENKKGQIFPEDKVRKVRKMIAASQHKRSLSKICYL